MSFFLRYFGATPSPSRNADDDRWWGGGHASQSVAGVKVDADTALKISTVWACRALLAETIASLPLVVFRSLAGDGRERARNHPLYPVLHDQPNETQTAAEFREMMTGHAIMTGNAFAQIKPGPRGPVDQLDPIHPDRIPRSNMERLPNGRLRYKVRQDDGSVRTFNQEDIFHLRGPSKDGIWGMSVIDYAIDSFGLTLAAERYGGRFFRNDSRPGGVLKSPKTLSDGAAKRLKSGWEAAHTAGNQHRVAILEEGLEWQQIGISPEEAQFLESREFQAEDVCRWFRVPPHMVGLTSKATSWGSGIENLGLGFVTYTLLPWLTRWTQSISRDLILAPDTYFADFIVEALLRGDIASRYNAYAIAIQWGILNPNEARRLENLNPRTDPGGDAYLQPLNMSPVGADGFGAETQRPRAVIGLNGHGPRIAQDVAVQEVATRDVATHYRLLAEEAAGRLVRKERAAVTRIYERNDDVAANVQAFYRSHVDLVAQTMRMPLAAAERYCTDQADAVLQAGGWLEMDADTVVRLADVATLNGEESYG